MQYATIEVSGQLGYELKDNKKPLTKEDFATLMDEIKEIKKFINHDTNNQSNQNQEKNIFQEIKSKKTEGKNEP